MLFVVVRIELAAEGHLLVGEPADGLPCLCVPQFDVSIRLMTNDDWYMKYSIKQYFHHHLRNIQNDWHDFLWSNAAATITPLFKNRLDIRTFSGNFHLKIWFFAATLAKWLALI